MTPNFSTFLRKGLSQVRKYGMKLLWYRYLVAPRILRSRPTPCAAGASLEVHTMLCRRDWIHGVWSLKSLACALGEPVRLVLFQDGSLAAEQVSVLRRQFPGVVVPEMPNVHAAAQARLAPLAPTIFDLWKSPEGFILRKTVNSWLLAERRYLLKIDPDVLFFQRPGELAGVEQTLAGRYAAFNAHRPPCHRDGMYCLNPELLRETHGIDLPCGFNEGLGAVDLAKVDWPFAEQIFRSSEILRSHLFLAAQTLEALWSARHGYVALDADRYNVEASDEPVTDRTVARHYLAKTRDRLYFEGIPRLLADRVFAREVFGR